VDLRDIELCHFRTPLNCGFFEKQLKEQEIDPKEINATLLNDE